MEFLLINHPLDCPICDQAGECKLQDYAFDFGIKNSRTREPRRALKKRVDLGPTIVFDQERCILCRRCVRFCDEIPKTGELFILDRGDRSVIETFPGRELDNPYSMNVADLCPVGALTTKDFRFKIRVWFLEDVPSVCSGCSNGCNIHMGVANNKVYRYQPRRNDDVNDTWICDEGRLSYREIDSERRLQRAYARGTDGVLEARPYAAAVEEAAARLRRLVDEKGPGVVAGIVSARATNEDLYTIRSFLEALGTEKAYVAVASGGADDLLIKSEKGPNAAGARALGFGDAAQAVERIRGGALDGLVIFGDELLGDAFLGGGEVLASLDTVVLVDSHRSELERFAHVVLPARHAAEKAGTFTNYAGRVQAIAAGVEPSWEAYDAGAIAAHLAAALGLAPFEGGYDVAAVSKHMAASVPALLGRDLASLGPGGAMLRLEGGGAVRPAGRDL
jgi:NADH-quinone oxidoreductase subunit G